MAYHPLNLGIRFLLEMSAAFCMGYWGWQQGEGFLRFVLAIGIPVGAFALWAIFAVPGDKSRSGEALVAVPGIVRLVYELVFFGFAIWALYDIGLAALSLTLGIVALVHYAVSYERIGWLLSQ